VNCPDCGAPNPDGPTHCVECSHPLDVPDTGRAPTSSSAAASGAAPAGGERPKRIERPERPDRIAPNVATWGYRPPGSGGDMGMPSWLWVGVGLFALVAVLGSAIQIARQPAPLSIPGATKPQLASAESLRVVLRRDTTAVAPNVALGNLFYDTNNYKESIPYYERALRRDPGLNDVRVDLGVAHHYAGNPEIALALLEEAVRVDSTHAIAWFDLAIIQESLGRTADARKNFRRARALPGPEAMGHVIDQMLARMDSAGAHEHPVPAPPRP
jgi:tetratricopeptide (TPR) repeat protein